MATPARPRPSLATGAAPPGTSVPIKDLMDFIGKVSVYADAEAKFKCYRGQRDNSWANTPGLFRPHLQNLASKEKRAVRDILSVHPQEFASDATMFDRLVRMQHFGLPTRLMDVSLNPLVAMYFATDPGPPGKASDGQVTAFAVPEAREKYFDSDSVSCIANLANLTEAEKNDIIRIRKGRVPKTRKSEEVERINEESTYIRLHQFIRAEKPYFLPIIDPIDLFKPYFVHPKLSNRRIIAQSGGFIIHGLSAEKPIRFAQKIEEKRFVIGQDQKEPIRKSLALLGINESTLFPELERAAKRIEYTYR